MYRNESLFFTKVFEFTFEHRSLVCPNPFCFFLLDRFSNTSAASFAYKAFSVCTLMYGDKTSTATSKYLTPVLYWAIFSIYATSTDQISFIRYATAFRLGNVFMNCLYFVYGLSTQDIEQLWILLNRWLSSVSNATKSCSTFCI